MSYEAGSDDDLDESSFALDSLNLSSDPSLQHFFQSIEELVGHGKREKLLLSCFGYVRQVDQKMYEESKKPVYQKPKTEKQAAEPVSEPVADVPAGLKSPTSSSAASFNQLSSQITSPLNRDSAQAALIAAKQQDTRQAELIAAKKRELKESKKWYQWGNKNNTANNQSKASPANNATKSVKSPTVQSPSSSTSKSPSNTTSQPAPAPISPISGQSTLASFPTDHTGASPITFLLTNLAVYILPPAIGLSEGETTKYFLVLNQYYRISLHDLCLVSLPYRSGVSLSGGDYALRINDYCLHLRSGLSVWLQSPRGRRSAVIEALSDAYYSLMKVQVQMVQPDYSELIGAIVQQTINQSIKRMRMESWAVATPKMEGWLVHRQVQEHASATSKATGDQSIKWTTRWFILTSDDYLLQFDSPAELEAFRTIVRSEESSGDITDFNQSNNQSTNTAKKQSALISKLPAHFDFIDIDLTRAVIRATEKSTANQSNGASSKRHISSFDVLVFPRNETTGSPVYDQDYTRHLFTVVPPIDPSVSIINQSSSQSINQSINQLYARRPTVKIPMSQSDSIVPPSPASAKHADADKNRTEQLINQQAAEIESLNQAMKFFPTSNQHPFGALTFTQSTIDTMYELTEQWYDSISQAINLSSMGGTRSAADSQGARAAMKKHGYQTHAPTVRTTHHDEKHAEQQELGNGLFKPMIEALNSPSPTSMDPSSPSDESPTDVTETDATESNEQTVETAESANSSAAEPQVA